MSSKQKKGPFSLYVEGLRTSVMSNASAYGFSIMITASYAVLSTQHGSPEIGEIFFFLLGAVGGFVLVEAAASRGFRSRDRGEPPNVMVVGSAFAFASVSAGVGAAALVGEIVDGDMVWPLGGVAATCVYTLVVGVEMMLAARAESAD